MVTSADVVEKYMQETRLSSREFAIALNQDLVNNSITHASVVMWSNGKSIPATDFLLAVYGAYTDWRHQFAIDCLQAKLPGAFEQDKDGHLCLIASN